MAETTPLLAAQQDQSQQEKKAEAVRQMSNELLALQTPKQVVHQMDARTTSQLTTINHEYEPPSFTLPFTADFTMHEVVNS